MTKLSKRQFRDLKYFKRLSYLLEVAGPGKGRAGTIVGILLVPPKEMREITSS